MTVRGRIGVGLLLVGLFGTGGCSVQDANQPPVGSISVGARKDSVAPDAARGKTKSAPASRQ